MRLNWFSNDQEESFFNYTVHRAVERWIDLNQFVYGLPKEYTYAVATKKKKNGRSNMESKVFVRVGPKSWFGRGLGEGQSQSLRAALSSARPRKERNFFFLLFFRRK